MEMLYCFLKDPRSMTYLDPYISTPSVADRFEQKVMEEHSCSFSLLGLVIHFGGIEM